MDGDFEVVLTVNITVRSQSNFWLTDAADALTAKMLVIDKRVATTQRSDTSRLVMDFFMV
jgi:hypothetical protein